MSVNYEELLNKFEEEFKKISDSIKKPNILIAGATGVGKSSVINMVFGDHVAAVGTGKPVTQKIDVYESDNCDVKIFDSKGYELIDSDDDEFYNKVVNLAAETKNPEDSIHIIWYCIAVSGGRVQDYDKRAIEAFLASNLPVAVVLTKADLGTDEEVAKMKAALPDRVKNCVFETSTKLPKYNHLDELIDWSVSVLPESLRFAFIKSQRVNLEMKLKTARKYIKQQCALAFGIGFTPIPVADAPILVVNELALIARILHLYDLKGISDNIKSLGISTIIGKLLTSLGKSAVANLLKLIPGAGTIIGGFISGGVGATITAATGEATNLTSYKIYKARLDGKADEAEELVRNFGDSFTKYASEWIKSGKSVDDLEE